MITAIMSVISLILCIVWVIADSKRIIEKVASAYFDLEPNPKYAKRARFWGIATVIWTILSLLIIFV